MTCKTLMSIKELHKLHNRNCHIITAACEQMLVKKQAINPLLNSVINNLSS